MDCDIQKVFILSDSVTYTDKEEISKWRKWLIMRKYSYL